MVGVQLSGGLGNQMFEYALYLKLKSMGKDVRIDDVTCYGAQEKQRVNQLSVFGVSYERMTKQEYEQITDSSMSPLHRARRLLRGRKLAPPIRARLRPPAPARVRPRRPRNLR